MNILITGTSSGIGSGLAHEFLERRAQVYGISRRGNDELSDKTNFHHLQLDLTNTEDVHQKLPKFVDGLKTFDLVILNAGVLGEIKYMNEVSVGDMKGVMEINVWANKNLLDLLFNLKIEIKQVVGMSSKAALRSSPGWGSYSLSKAALDMLMDIYAKEYTKTHFSAFAPGLVDSEIQDIIYDIKDVDKYPSAKTLQSARYTDEMPDAYTAAAMLIAGMVKVLKYKSGSHVDVREI
jgi:NAD(P)-dependent dehydrogenase (short-subunit alcohol dehydrogenase family)